MAGELRSKKGDRASRRTATFQYSSQLPPWPAGVPARGVCTALLLRTSASTSAAEATDGSAPTGRTTQDADTARADGGAVRMAAAYASDRRGWRMSSSSQNWTQLRQPGPAAVARRARRRRVPAASSPPVLHMPAAASPAAAVMRASLSSTTGAESTAIASMLSSRTSPSSDPPSPSPDAPSSWPGEHKLDSSTTPPSSSLPLSLPLWPMPSPPLAPTQHLPQPSPLPPSLPPSSLSSKTKPSSSSSLTARPPQFSSNHGPSSSSSPASLSVWLWQEWLPTPAPASPLAQWMSRTCQPLSSSRMANLASRSNIA
eukprot:scaffold8106_cov107-Isochrysis_galbana.AAC.3